MAHRPPSLRLRLIGLIGIASALVLMVFDWVIVRSIEIHFAELDADRLRAHAETVAHALAYTARDGRDHDLPALQRALAGHHGLLVRITDAEGTVLHRTPGPDLARFAATVPSTPAIEPASLHPWQDGGHHYQGAVLTLPTTGAASPLTVTLAIGMDIHLRYLAEFYRALGLTTLGAFAVLLLAVGVAVHQGHAPLRRITAQIRTIGSDQLHIRLRPETLPEELVELARSFNQMLERIEQVFRQLSHFSADIAHELRTPVTNLMTQTQVALGETRNADEYREILYSNLEEHERMAQMIGDMLFLAKTDNGLLKPGRGPVDLAHEIRELFDFLGAWAEARGVALVLEGEAVSPGDRLMLRRALSNLLGNAIRHTDTGGTVRVGLASQAGQIQVSVENTGSVIPAEYLPRVFDRFFRIDPARQHHGEGAGLGLAIVKSIVEAHGGRISVDSGNGLTRFRIELSA